MFLRTALRSRPVSKSTNKNTTKDKYSERNKKLIYLVQILNKLTNQRSIHYVFNINFILKNYLILDTTDKKIKISYRMKSTEENNLPFFPQEFITQ